MRRNYGSLNLAALDLSSSATIGDARFQESFMLAHDLAHLDVSSSSEHDDCASAVGYPIEYFAMMHDGDNEDDHYNDAYARADAPRCRKRSLSEHGLGAETRASSSASITSTCSTASTSSNASNVSTGISIPVTVTTAVKASSSSLQSSSYHSSVQKQHRLALDLPPRLVEQHHVELNALRCLSLNLMLSSSTPSGSSSGMMTMPQPSTSVPKVNSFEFEIGCQPQTDRVTAALLAGRRSSLPRNMIQSV